MAARFVYGAAVRRNWPAFKISSCRTVRNSDVSVWIDVPVLERTDVRFVKLALFCSKIGDGLGELVGVELEAKSSHIMKYI